MGLIAAGQGEYPVFQVEPETTKEGLFFDFVRGSSNLYNRNKRQNMDRVQLVYSVDSNGDISQKN